MEILADKLRPKKISEVIGQKHLIGSGKILTNLVNNKRLFSMILYGKPGIGKTSIANALVSELELRYKFMNATINNKNDFDVAIAEAKMYGDMVLIVDEMALSPKSNSSHLALDEALNDIHKGNTGNVPDNIKTNSKEYLYPHNYPKSWVKQEYMPINLRGKIYYHPKDNKVEQNLNKLHNEMRSEQ